jgi:hypothetical protein
MQKKNQHTYESQASEWFTPAYGPGKIAGALMIAIGAIYLLGMSGIKIMGHSPWILMTLAPVLWAGLLAYNSYRRTGRISGKVLAIAAAGFLPLVFVAAAMLGYNVAALWPLGLIGLGIAFLVTGKDWIQP